MAKTLSEQICEECGIKPYYGVFINLGDLDNNYKLVANKRKCRLIADYRYMVDNDDELRNLKPKYLPDFFENSNNFVRLYELKIVDDVTLAQLFFTWNLANYSKELFLKNLIYILKEDSNMDKTVIEFIKQAIQNEQWEV